MANLNTNECSRNIVNASSQNNINLTEQNVMVTVPQMIGSSSTNNMMTAAAQ